MKTSGFGRRARVAIGGGVFCLGLAAAADLGQRRLSLQFPGARFEATPVGSGAWWPAAFAQGSNPVTLEDVRIELEASTISIPRLEIEAPGLSRVDLSGLLDPKGSEPWAARLARMSASAIRAPEITVEQRAGSVRETATYRDVLAENVVNGRVGRVSASGGSVEMRRADEMAQSGRFGRTVAEHFDLAETARVASETAGAEPPPLKPIQGAFSMDAFATDGPDGSHVKIGRLAVRNIRARPVNASWSAALEALAPYDWSGDPQRASRAVRAAADVADAFAIGSAEVSGIVVGQPGGSSPTALRIARMAYQDARDGRLAEARIEGIDLNGTSRAEVATMALTGFSFDTTIAGLKALAAKPVGSLEQADLRKIVPASGTLRLEGVAIDVPDAKSTPPGSGRTKLGLREVEFAADRAVNGAPTDVRFGFKGLTFAIPADSPPESLKALADMGYRTLDLSFASASGWDPATGQLAVRDFSLSGEGMGRTRLTGVLGRVSPEAFDPDPAVSLVALLGATAKSAELTLSNEGLVERIMADQAAKRGKAPDELRRDLGAMAAVGIAPMLGNSPGAQAIGQAVARFIARPGRLTISARTKDAEGLGIADISALGEAAAVLDKLDVTATAN